MVPEIDNTEKVPDTSPAQPEKRVIPRTTLIAAIVVLAAVAMIIIWANMR